MVENTLTKWAIQFLPLAGSLVGTYFGYLLGLRTHRTQKRHDFIVDQLRDFYTPMLKFRSDIAFEMIGSTNLREIEKVPSAERFEEHVWPLYRKLDSYFGDHRWLASADTRKWFPNLNTAVQRQQVWFDNNLVSDDEIETLVESLNHKFDPFFTHLEAKLDELQRKLMPKG